jgi:hypothetical protein
MVLLCEFQSSGRIVGNPEVIQQLILPNAAFATRAASKMAS